MYKSLLFSFLALTYSYTLLPAQCTTIEDHGSCANALLISLPAPDTGPLCFSACVPAESFGDPICNNPDTEVIWYEFITGLGANELTVQLSGISGNVAIYEELCTTNLLPCRSFFSGESLTFVIRGNISYYIAIQSEEIEAPFDLCLEAKFVSGTCSEGEITSSRPENPTLNPAGPYFPGETVDFTYTIEWTADIIGQGNNCQWLQGILPTIGGGWDLNTMPINVQGPGDDWEWLLEGNVTHKVPSNVLSTQQGAHGLELVADFGGLSPGDPLPQGWWFASPGLGNNCIGTTDPNTTWGLPTGCGSTQQTSFDFSLQVKNNISAAELADPNLLNIQLFGLADGQTGCWLNNTCSDNLPTTFSARVEPTASMCLPPNLTSVCHPSELDGLRDSLVLGTDAIEPGQIFPLCDGFTVPNNMKWYSFIVPTETLEISITDLDCVATSAGMGLQAGIYVNCVEQGNCLVSVNLCDEDVSDISFSLSNLTVGDTLFLYVDGCNGSSCGYNLEFDTDSGFDLDLECTSVVLNSFNITWNTLSEYTTYELLVLGDLIDVTPLADFSLSSFPNNTEVILVASGNGVCTLQDITVCMVVDNDNDGVFSSEDCNDNNPNIFPSNPEVCDGLDNNCNGQVDEDFTLMTFYSDNDRDGYGVEGTGFMACMQPPDTTTESGDCDDNNPAINPSATEIPNNGIDEDCDGADATSGIHDINGVAVSIYPNPVIDKLVIQSDYNQLQYALYNTNGQLLMKGELNHGVLDMSTLVSGYYVLKLNQPGLEETIVQGVVKN